MTAEVRYGIVGAGMMGLEHFRNLRALPGAVVTAVADPHPESLARARATAGDDPLACFPSHVELLESGLVDAVVVASPNLTHAAVLRDVLASPLPVLVEKPLCTTVADCRAVLAATRERDAIVWVGLEYRFMPPVARLVQEVRAGAVGRVHMVAIREHRFPFLSKVGDWNRFNRNTGGTLVEKCCHFFDLMTHIVGAAPVRVLASGGQDVNHLDERYDGEVPDILDNAFVIVEFASGARAMLDLCMFAEGSEHQEELSVVGDAGKVAGVPAGRGGADRGARTLPRGGPSRDRAGRAGGARGLPPRVELPRAPRLPRRDLQRWTARGRRRAGPAVGRGRRRRAPQHRRGSTGHDRGGARGPVGLTVRRPRRPRGLARASVPGAA
ncbi:MAG: Gfo/Idh/MocA family protein [Acidimicrobiia bacterium]